MDQTLPSVDSSMQDALQNQVDGLIFLIGAEIIIDFSPALIFAEWRSLVTFSFSMSPSPYATFGLLPWDIICPNRHSIYL